MSHEFWNQRSVLVTGGSGFVGSHLVDQLVNLGANVTVTSRKDKTECAHLRQIINKINFMRGDLQDFDFALEASRGQSVVMNLAAVVGGIEYNIKNPASVFKDNMTPFLNIIEAARMNNAERFLVTSSACVYPRIVKTPTPEEEGIRDEPEETNRAYGWAKRMQEYLGASYSRQYGMKVALARPYNCYGPRDNFNPESSHVIPALIRRIWKSRENPIRVWGSGKQTRSFLYVDDFAKGLVEVTEHYAVADVLNLGRNEEVNISQLVQILADIFKELEGRDLKIEFDMSKPEGQPRRHCDTTKAAEKIGYRADTELRDGLRKTIDWYLKEGMPDE